MTQNSILTSIKKVLNVAEEDTSFDVDIIMHINSVFSNLLQMGFGTNNFVLQDKSQVWTDFCNKQDVENLKSYVYLKVRMLFDPPTSSIVMDAFEKQAKEFEWRLYISAQGGNY